MKQEASPRIPSITVDLNDPDFDYRKNPEEVKARQEQFKETLQDIQNARQAINSQFPGNPLGPTGVPRGD